MRFVLDAKYSGIVRECSAALEAVVPPKRASTTLRRGERCLEVWMYWNHWPRVFPQAGPGKKHLRRIELAAWQRELVGQHRQWFVRGLIHSDGCRYVAADRGRPSVRYGFSNRSQDIKDLLVESLDALGISWTRSSLKEIAIYRAGSVMKLDEFVGPKY
jgi:hypothetical protein